MGYFNFYFFKKVFYFIKNHLSIKTLLIIIILILIFSNSSFGFTNYTYDTDIYNTLIERQRIQQNNFIYLMAGAYYGNTQSWNTIFKPMLDDIGAHNYDIHVFLGFNNSTDTVYAVECYNSSNAVSSTPGDEYFGIDYSATNILKRNFTDIKRYTIAYSYSLNTHVYQVDLNQSGGIPACIIGFKSELYYQFVNMVYNTHDSTGFLSQIYSSISSIETVDNDILAELQSLSSMLTQISSSSSSSSSQVSAISNKINDILTDNDTIINQNSQMIQQQEEINDNLEQVSQDVQDVKDTITDPTVTSTASDLPSTSVNNPTENGIDNIFTSIYNAFCVGQAQDIVFPIPFTDKNITLSPYYVKDMLNNNNAGWVYTLIQAFWGYLIGRYIISDISKKIEKIKTGDIENIENSNIKEEML